MTHKIQIRVDSGGIQGLTPTPKIGFGGAQQCLFLTSYPPVGKTLFGPVHPGKGGDNFLLAPTTQKPLILLHR